MGEKTLGQMKFREAPEEIIRERISALTTAGRYRKLVPPPVGVDLMTNDYLGFRSDVRLAQAASEAAETYGTGAGASRLLGGNFAIIGQLETALAKLKGTQSALVFPSGYVANIALISAFVREGDAVWSDESNHASIIDGCKLSRGHTFIFPHNDVDALVSSLRNNRRKYRLALIVTEAVFSMSGDLCPLSGLNEAAKEYDAVFLVDEAHSTGVLEPEGKGICSYYGEDVGDMLLMGTLSKALGSQGGYLCASSEIVEYIVNTARPFIFTTGISIPAAAAALKAIELLETLPEDFRRLRLNCRHFAAGLRELGILADSDSAIFPIVIGNEIATMEAGSRLKDSSFYVGAVRPPAVPDGKSQLRITVSARHTTSQLTELLRVLMEMKKEGWLSD